VILFGCEAEWRSQWLGLNSPAGNMTEKAINSMRRLCPIDLAATVNF
jgi:hypothetical protein